MPTRTLRKNRAGKNGKASGRRKTSAGARSGKSSRAAGKRVSRGARRSKPAPTPRQMALRAAKARRTRAQKKALAAEEQHELQEKSHLAGATRGPMHSPKLLGGPNSHAGAVPNYYSKHNWDPSGAAKLHRF